MNKLTYSIEFSFDVDAGTIEPFDDVKLNTNRLIKDEIFINQRNLGVYMTVHVAVVIEATLNDDSEIDREKLFTLINKRGADDCWYSELDRYLNSTRFCGLEIGYR